MAARIEAVSLSNGTALWSRLTSGIFGRGAISFLVATAGINVSNFLFYIFVSRLLGPANYGAVGALLSILSLVAVPVGAAQLAVTQAVITQKLNDRPFSLGRVTWRALVGALIAMLTIGSLTPILDGFLHIHSPLPLILVCTWIPLATVAAVLQGALIGEYRFRSVAFAIFFGGGPLRLLLGIGTVLAGFGVVGAVAATIFAQAFTTGSLLFSARRELISHKHHSAIRIKVRDMTLSVAALASLTTLTGIDTFLARHFFTSALAGEYSAGTVAAHIALFVPGVIVTVAFPHLVKGKGTASQSRKAFREALAIAFVLSVAMATVLTVLASFVVRLLFGSSYAHAVEIMGVLAFASAAIGILSIFIYFHLTWGSLVALTPWLGVILATLLISIRHQTMTSVSTIILLVSVSTLIVAGVPALRALVAAAAKDASSNHSRVDLPPSEFDFTLVVPFYNPGPRFGEHTAEVLGVIVESGLTFEILATSDGGTDHIEDQFTKILSDRLVLVQLEKNRGKGTALRPSPRRGRGEYMGFIDGDGDLPASLINTCLEIIQHERPDVVFGSKRHLPVVGFLSPSDESIRRTISS